MSTRNLRGNHPKGPKKREKVEKNSVKRKRESSNEEVEAKKKNRKSRSNKVISVESDSGSDYEKKIEK